MNIDKKNLFKEVYIIIGRLLNITLRINMGNKANPRIKILVACHKSDPNIRQDDTYMPIQVGKALHPELNLGFQCDNTGDNISEKNGSYCELTALYWGWKNLKNVDYIGMCHYRRYFAFGQTTRPFESIFTFPSIKDLNTFEVDLDVVKGKCDIILPKRYTIPFSLEIEYCYAHIRNDYEIMKSVIEEIYPDYKDSFNYIMRYNNKISPFNMFVMSWEEFNKYCEWIFGVLFEVEKRIKISQYPDQARVFGYMAERLLNVYVYKNKLKVKYVAVNKISVEEGNSYWKLLLSSIRNNLSSRLIYSRH